MPLIDFINTFNNSRMNVFKIDPLNTFTMSITFDPEETKIKDRITKCGFTGVEQFGEKLDKFVQRITLPNFNITADSNIETIAHTAISHKMFLNPEQQTFTIDVINTKVPIIEEIFYPWLREVQYPEWQYPSRPYTTAKIDISLTSHSDVSYHLLKCRPTMMDTFNPSQELGPVTRTVTFSFDLMYVTYAGNYSQSGLKNLASKLVNKGLKTIGL